MSTRPLSVKPLSGLQILEIEGIGRGPVAGRILAALGAEVTVIARPTVDPGLQSPSAPNPLRVGTHVIVLDLEKSEDISRAP